MLFLDKLRVKCESLREIESELVKLLEVLGRHTARHLFRSSHLNPIQTGLFGPSLTGGGLWKPPLCNLKTVNAMVTKLTQDDVDNNSSNFRCLVDMLT